MKGHIDAYYSFKGMKDVKDKKELYKRINQKTDKPFCYASGDVYGEYEGVQVSVTPIERAT
jgi:hypothetical protein